MFRALQLAERARGHTYPNPMVGCVVVCANGAIFEGWHSRVGAAHAEVEALDAARRAGAKLQGASLYVTLEPCSHYGRTPPCADRIIEEGIAKVYIACLDPNPQVAGQGVAKLEAAKVEVVVGVLEREAQALNEVFFYHIQAQRPFVLYKYAMTLDGKTASKTGDARWVSSARAREDVHHLRHEYQAIAVGIGTVLADNPKLDCRLDGGRSPIKVIYDRRLRCPIDARIFEADDRGEAARVIIFHSVDADSTELRHRAQLCAIDAADDADFIGQSLGYLYEQGICSVLLEGGAQLAWAFLEAHGITKVRCYLAAKLLGGAAPTALAGAGFERMAQALPLHDIQVEAVGDDNLVVEGRLQYP